MLVLWIIGALVVLVAVVVCALQMHTRRAQRRAELDPGPRYAPTSADPRGRWQVSRHGDDLLEPARYVLNTDHDGPAGTPPAPPTTRPEYRARGTEWNRGNRP
ncbi:hypothetical protein [Amycolatopsis sp. NPDC051903]|uniref:hypothetical protein n=1 Tax=Amycolatopsis sp. NPDC051903 TaxID=3363936 RepID=UPI0037AAC11B